MEISSKKPDLSEADYNQNFVITTTELFWSKMKIHPLKNDWNTSSEAACLCELNTLFRCECILSVFA